MRSCKYYRFASEDALYDCLLAVKLRGVEEKFQLGVAAHVKPDEVRWMFRAVCDEDTHGLIGSLAAERYGLTRLKVEVRVELKHHQTMDEFMDNFEARLN